MEVQRTGYECQVTEIYFVAHDTIVMMVQVKTTYSSPQKVNPLLATCENCASSQRREGDSSFHSINCEMSECQNYLVETVTDRIYTINNSNYKS